MTTTPYARDMVAVTETVLEWRERNGVVLANDNGLVTTQSYQTGSDVQKKHGYITRLGDKIAKKTISTAQLVAALNCADDSTLITEIYPTRFCVHCEEPAWNFIDYPERGHSTCKRCGTCNKSHAASEHFSLHMSDETQKANKNMWNFTPGMNHNDTETRCKGKVVVSYGKRVKSHKRNYWNIRKKIDQICDAWHFAAIESIIRSAKSKLRAFYYTIHSDEDEDDERKMPHGTADLAASCVYASVLEFEERVGFKTVCTLPAIQESAQSSRDVKSNRRTRDVTDVKIIRYTNMLKNAGICGAKVPHIGAETLRFHPKSSALQHSRMALFNECTATRFNLSSTGSWGITISDSKKGVLVINSVKTNGKAFEAGIRKNDYIFQVDRNTVSLGFNPVTFQTWVQKIRKATNKPTVEFTIMRKKQN